MIGEWPNIYRNYQQPIKAPLDKDSFFIPNVFKKVKA